MPKFSPDPEELFRDVNERVDKIRDDLPGQEKLWGLLHTHSKASLNQRLDTAEDSAKRASKNAELQLKYGAKSDDWLQELREKDHNFHNKTKAVRDEVDSRANTPAESIMEGIGKVGKYLTPSELKGLMENKE